MAQLVFNVNGIKCGMCEASIQEKLEKSTAVETAVADSITNTVEIIFDPAKTNTNTLKQVIIDHGLEIVS